MITFRLPRPGIRLFQPNKILFILWLFLLVFPKGGFKIAGVPLTWGYFLLTSVSIFFLFRSRFSLHIPRLQAFLMMTPFQIIAAWSMVIHGVEGGFGISFIFNFFFFPWCFFIFLSEALESIDIQLFFTLIRIGVFTVAAYGVFLFFFKITTGKFIEIPLLTVNFHDFGEIENKHINRGLAFKLISTYNNGNIYGICILMLLPLYLLLEKKNWRKYIVFISLILTLSRTVWIGLIFSQFVGRFFASKKNSLLQEVGVICMSLLAIILVTYLIGNNFSFFFDSNLGGRKNQLLVLENMTFFPNHTFINIGEIAYLGILVNFGLIGLLAYLLCLTGPLIIGFSLKNLSLVQKRILLGLITHLIISMSDAAILFIPVLVFYWFLSAFALRRGLARDASCSNL